MTSSSRLPSIRKPWLHALTVIVLFVLTFRMNSIPIYSGLDGSYRFAFQQGKSQFDALFDGAASSALEPPLSQ